MDCSGGGISYLDTPREFLDSRTEFHSAVFGFVDDLKCYFGPPETIRARSASRTGYCDFGVNCGRVETFRARFSTISNASRTTVR